MQVTLNFEASRYTVELLEKLAVEIYNAKHYNISKEDLFSEIIQQLVDDTVNDVIEDRIHQYTEYDETDKQFGCSMGELDRLVELHHNAQVYTRKYHTLKNQLFGKGEN